MTACTIVIVGELAAGIMIVKLRALVNELKKGGHW